jgi:hypothetical protein
VDGGTVSGYRRRRSDCVDRRPPVGLNAVLVQFVEQGVGLWGITLAKLVDGENYFHTWCKGYGDGKLQPPKRISFPLKQTMEAHALGVGYVPMVRGRTHFLRVRSNFHRSLNVDDVEVQPPKMYIEFSAN